MKTNNFYLEGGENQIIDLSGIKGTLKSAYIRLGAGIIKNAQENIDLSVSFILNNNSLVNNVVIASQSNGEGRKELLNSRSLNKNYYKIKVDTRAGYNVGCPIMLFNVFLDLKLDSENIYSLIWNIDSGTAVYTDACELIITYEEEII